MLAIAAGASPGTDSAARFGSWPPSGTRVAGRTSVAIPRLRLNVGTVAWTFTVPCTATAWQGVWELGRLGKVHASTSSLSERWLEGLGSEAGEWPWQIAVRQLLTSES